MDPQNTEQIVEQTNTEQIVDQNLDQQEYAYWSCLQVKTTKAPKKGVEIKTLQKLREIKDTVICAQCWLFPFDQGDKVTLKAMMELPNVKQIGIYGRHSKAVNDFQLQFPPLRKLRFGQCELTQIKPYIYNNTSLVELNLNSNNLTYLPEQMQKLTNLKMLSLYENKTEQFPKVILKLTQLEMLYIHHGPLADVPQQIGKLKNLKQLFLNDNPNLKKVPAKAILNNMKGLKSFSAHGTPWSETAQCKELLKQLKKRGVILV